jgi:hypothetical protein
MRTTYIIKISIYLFSEGFFFFVFQDYICFITPDYRSTRMTSLQLIRIAVYLTWCEDALIHSTQIRWLPWLCWTDKRMNRFALVTCFVVLCWSRGNVQQIQLNEIISFASLTVWLLQAACQLSPGQLSYAFAWIWSFRDCPTPWSFMPDLAM